MSACEITTTTGVESAANAERASKDLVDVRHLDGFSQSGWAVHLKTGKVRRIYRFRQCFHPEFKSATNGADLEIGILGMRRFFFLYELDTAEPPKKEEDERT